MQTENKRTLECSPLLLFSWINGRNFVQKKKEKCLNFWLKEQENNLNYFNLLLKGELI